MISAVATAAVLSSELPQDTGCVASAVVHDAETTTNADDAVRLFGEQLATQVGTFRTEGEAERATVIAAAMLRASLVNATQSERVYAAVDAAGSQVAEFRAARQADGTNWALESFSVGLPEAICMKLRER